MRVTTQKGVHRSALQAPDSGVLFVSQLHLPSTIMFSDMTGTMLRQSADGSRFPEKNREGIAKFVESGGNFVLVTGDSLEVTQEQFLRHLPQLKGRMFLILHSGAEIYRYEEKICHELYKAPPIPLEVRAKSFEIFASEILEVYGVDISSELATRSLGTLLDYAKRGPRIEIESISRLIGRSFYVEVSPYKVTVYCEEGEIHGSKTDLLFRNFSTDRRLIDCALNANAHLMRGAIYFELISHSKEQGIRMFCDEYLPEELRTDRSVSNVILLGDSPNDEGMFLNDYGKHFGFATVRAFFMGNEEQFVGELVANVAAPSNFTYLKGEHEMGATKVFSSLLG